MEAELRGETEIPKIKLPKKRTREEIEKSEKELASIVMSKKNRKNYGYY